MLGTQGAAKAGFLHEGGQAGAKDDHSTVNALTVHGTVLCEQGVQHPSTVPDKARWW